MDLSLLSVAHSWLARGPVTEIESEERSPLDLLRCYQHSKLLFARLLPWDEVPVDYWKEAQAYEVDGS